MLFCHKVPKMKIIFKNIVFIYKIFVNYKIFRFVNPTSSCLFFIDEHVQKKKRGQSAKGKSTI